jgi:hypothetical protein
MTLHPNSYDWRFVPEAGKTFSDAGTRPAIRRPPGTSREWLTGAADFSTRAATVDGMSRPRPTRRWRRLLALVLAVVAVGLVVVEPFPKGEVLLSLTHTHGVDTGDIPALAMLLVAACLAV